MLDNKKTYYWLEKLNNMNFDIMCINKIFDTEIEKSILELEDMGKKITIINNTIKKLDAASMEEIKNLEK